MISLCMVMVLVFSLSAVCASAAQEAVAEQPTVSMSFDLDNRVKHEKNCEIARWFDCKDHCRTHQYGSSTIWSVEDYRNKWVGNNGILD